MCLPNKEKCNRIRSDMASGTEIIRSIYKITHFDFLLDLVHDVKRIFICICMCDPENLLFWLYNVVTDQIDQFVQCGFTSATVLVRNDIAIFVST